MIITIHRRSVFILTGCIVLAAFLFFLFNKPIREIFNPPRVITTASPALQALSAMYSSDPVQDRAAWEETVCAGMTADGCVLFQDLYAPVFWAARGPAHQAQTTMLSVAEELEDGSQIWRVGLQDSGPQAEILAHTERDPISGEWMLVRLLFRQEYDRYLQKAGGSS